MVVFAVRFTAAWGLPVTDGSAHVENLVPVYPNRVLDTVCACLSLSHFIQLCKQHWIYMEKKDKGGKR